jgi:hypothetical protein
MRSFFSGIIENVSISWADLGTRELLLFVQAGFAQTTWARICVSNASFLECCQL